MASGVECFADRLRGRAGAPVIVALLLLAPMTPVRAEPLFVAPFLLFDTGGAPTAVAVADLDGDGRPDLVTANSVSGTVSVLRGNGDGTFGARTDFATGGTPRSLAIADLDGDGRPDLVVGKPGAVSVLLGIGDGTFQPRVDYGTGGGARSVAIGDLNGDGRPDLAVANSSVSVHPGNGDGTFGARTDVCPECGATAVAIADFDHDGRQDVVATNGAVEPSNAEYMHSVSVLPGNGDGTFGPAAGFDAGIHPFAVATADFDGDGSMDFAVASSFERQTAVAVLLGDGEGTFRTHSWFNAGVTPVYIASGDFNGDGRPDLVTANYCEDPDIEYQSNTVSVRLGNGDGTFRFAGDLDVGEDPYCVAVADLNGDGRPDLAVANQGSSTISILLGNGDGTFGTVDARLPGAPRTVAIGDLNGDGWLDLAVPNYYSPLVSVLFGNGTGRFEARTDLDVGGWPGSVAIADLNQDGRLDLAAGTSTNVSVLLGNGNGTFGTPSGYGGGGPSPRPVAIGDLNGDGRPDLVAVNTYLGTTSIMLGNGDGTFGAATYVVTGSWPTATAIADLNGDGRLDLAVTNLNSYTVSVLLGYGDGRFRDPIDYNTGGAPEGVSIGDLNADGRPDLVVAGHHVSVLLGNGDGTFGARAAYAAGDEPISVAIADFDADGRPDLAVANNHLAGAVTVLPWNGDGTFGAGTRFGAGKSPIGVASADLNADGQPDLAVANWASRSVSVLLGTADAPTPVQMSLVSAEATPDRVTLRWWGTGAGSLGASVYRREEGGEWLLIGDAIAEGADLVRYDDRAVTPGSRYAYRLGWLEGGAESFSSEVRVEAPAALRLALEGFRPNPAFDSPVVAFALGSDSPATIEVLDVAGRSVLRREVGGLGAGRHVLRLEGSAGLTPGTYVVRLRQAGRTLSARGVIVR